MGMKEKFFENMMGQMSADEKKAMMGEMMDKFFSGVPDEEKREMMREMMTRMMGGGGEPGAHHHRMRMMKFMMGGGKEGEGFDPMEMCRKMMGGAGRGGEAPFATPEIRTLFEEWARQMDEEILSLIDGGSPSDLDGLAAKLKISKESLIFFLARLAQKGEIGLRPERTRKS